MAAADQSISLMDGTYFVGRKEILEWINSICETSLTKVEQTCSGAIACQIIDCLYPGKVPMSRVDWSANKDYEYIQNYKVLQKCFTNLKIDKHVDVDRLIRGKYQDNLEFMQWFKKFYELNATGQPYDAIAAREKGKGGAAFSMKYPGGGGFSSSGASRATSNSRVRSSAKTSGRTGRTAPGPSIRRAERTGSSSSLVSNEQHLREIEELSILNDNLTAECNEMRAAVEGLEKERDFYFSKLRDIEIFLQGVEDAETNELAQNIFKVLYATEDEFVQPEEGMEQNIGHHHDEHDGLHDELHDELHDMPHDMHHDMPHDQMSQ